MSENDDFRTQLSEIPKLLQTAVDRAQQLTPKIGHVRNETQDLLERVDGALEILTYLDAATESAALAVERCKKLTPPTPEDAEGLARLDGLVGELRDRWNSPMAKLRTLKAALEAYLSGPELKPDATKG